MQPTGPPFPYAVLDGSAERPGTPQKRTRLRSEFSVRPKMDPDPPFGSPGTGRRPRTRIALGVKHRLGAVLLARFGGTDRGV